jgi:NAD(P)H-dependent FMN reductase
MKIQIICGSPRQNSQSLNVSRFVSSILYDHTNIDHDIISIADLINEDPKYFTLEENVDLTSGANLASGFVFVAPEYSGMAPPAAKQWFFKIGQDALAHKPVLLVSVSAGVGGTYPIAEIRSAATKNNRLICIPEHIIVRNINDDCFFEKNAQKGSEETKNVCGMG